MWRSQHKADSGSPHQQKTNTRDVWSWSAVSPPKPNYSHFLCFLFKRMVVHLQVQQSYSGAAVLLANPNIVTTGDKSFEQVLQQVCKGLGSHPAEEKLKKWIKRALSSDVATPKSKAPKPQANVLLPKKVEISLGNLFLRSYSYLSPPKPGIAILLGSWELDGF